MTSEPVPLSQHAAIELVYAATASLAAQYSIRALSIKGLALERQGLRPGRTPADADILVDPTQHRALASLLNDRGWVQRNGRAVPSLLPLHSIELIRPDWPCDIDLHWYYPGFHASPSEIFESLWSRRTEESFAGYPVPTVDAASNLVIMALHAARNPRSERHQTELRYAMRNGSYSTSDVASVVRLGRAQSVLFDFMAGIGVPVERDLSSEESALWTAYCDTNELGSTSAWMVAISSAAWPDKVRIAAHAIFPSKADLMLDALAGDSTRSCVGRSKMRLARVKRGLQAIPSTVAGLWRYHVNSRSR